MKIVVLDGFAGNPGDVSWSEMEALGVLKVYDRTNTEDIIERAKDAEVILTNKVVLTRDILQKLPSCKLISVLATGFDVVDVKAAKELGILVCNVPAYSTMSVAQLVFSHILNLTHHVAEHSADAKNGKWSSAPDFAYWDFPLVELDGLTMGVVGYGQIAKAVIGIALSFGMKVIVSTRTIPQEKVSGVEFVDMDFLFANSDVLSLHCPLNEGTKNLVNADRLSLMKENAFLINTSRGPVVDEAALAEALNSGKIAGAGVDVLSCEPPKSDNPLLDAKNCYVTPHYAWASQAARRRLMQISVHNIKAYKTGTPINVVNA